MEKFSDSSQCQICQKEFGSGPRKALMLSCKHKFCRHCLKKIASEKGILCPTCFQRDVRQLQDLSKRNQPMDSVSIYQSINVQNKVNEISPTEEQTTEQSQKQLTKEKIKVTCIIHNQQPALFFCKACQAFSCNFCIVEHSGHYFIGTEDPQLVVEIFSKLQKLKENYQEAQSKSQKKLLEANQLLLRLEQEQEHYLKTIEAHFQKLQDVLQHRKDQLTKQIKNYYEPQIVNSLDIKNTIEQKFHSVSELFEKIAKFQEELQELSVIEQFQQRKHADSFQEIDLTEFTLIDNANKQADNVEINLEFPQKHLDWIYNYGEVKQKKLVSNGSQKDLQQNDTYPRFLYFIRYNSNKITQFDSKTEEFQSKTIKQIKFPYECRWITLLDQNKVLITGGVVEPTKQAWSYNFLKNSLKEVTPMLNGRYSHGMIYFQKHVYVFGGHERDIQPLALCERYDIKRNLWSGIASLNIPRDSVTPCALGSKIYLFGGFNSDGSLDSIEIYDPMNNVMSLSNLILPVKNYSIGIVQVSNLQCILFGGGFQGMNYRVEAFNFDVKKFANTVFLPKGRKFMGQGANRGGKIFSFDHNGAICKFNGNRWTILWH